MRISEFINLVKSGIDVSFNYNDVFYTISLIEENGNEKKYGIGSDNGFTADFDDVESILEFVLQDKKIEEIILHLKEEEIFY